MYYRPGGKNEKEQFAYLYLTMQQYLAIKVDEKSVETFFEKHNYKNIIIYGVEGLGSILYKDLKRTNIVCFMDNNATNYKGGVYGLSVCSSEEIVNWHEIDVVVITDLYEANKAIDKLLESGCDLGKIINISDIVFGLE